jgi:hypothetical protein
MIENPYQSPRSDCSTTTARQLENWNESKARAMAFVWTLGTLLGFLVAFVLMYSHGVSASRQLDYYLFFGTAASIFGLCGGYFANLLVVNRVPVNYVVIAFGIFAIGLPFIHDPSYGGVATLVALIAACHAPLTICIGIIFRIRGFRD